LYCFAAFVTKGQYHHQWDRAASVTAGGDVSEFFGEFRLAIKIGVPLDNVDRTSSFVDMINTWVLVLGAGTKETNFPPSIQSASESVYFRVGSAVWGAHCGKLFFKKLCPFRFGASDNVIHDAAFMQ
jgi:hypothetical protein